MNPGQFDLGIKYLIYYSFSDSLGWLVFMIFGFFNSNPNFNINNYHQLPMFQQQCYSLLQGTSAHNTVEYCLSTVIR